jgi:hypothetical protein
MHQTPPLPNTNQGCDDAPSPPGPAPPPAAAPACVCVWDSTASPPDLVARIDVPPDGKTGG